ncbi:MAG: hypothetical protein ACRCX2_30015 [Paraclostridium sp.]
MSYYKDWYEGLKARNICPSCRKKKVIDDGKVCCITCRESRNHKAQLRKSNLSDDDKDKSRAKSRGYVNKRNDALRGKGLCYVCGKRSVAHTNKSRCEVCISKQKVRINEKRRVIRYSDTSTREYWLHHNLCFFCGKPRMDNKKVCVECYAKLYGRMMAAREIYKESEING